MNSKDLRELMERAKGGVVEYPESADVVDPYFSEEQNAI